MATLSPSYTSFIAPDTADVDKELFIDWAAALEALLQTFVVGPATVTDGHFMQFDGTSGKLSKGGLSFDTDGTMAANSASRVPAQAAVVSFVSAFVAAYVAAQDIEIFKGGINCSANPNYPAADAGHVYRVSHAGKIGGASGPNVEVNDRLECLADSTASGNHATVGANWMISQVNIDGAVTGPASSTSGNVAVMSGTSGKIIDDGGKTIAQIEASAVSTVRGTASSGYDTLGEIESVITGKHSIEVDAAKLHLVGDTASPGNNKVYGTDGSGNRGWKDDPTGGGGLSAIADDRVLANISGSPAVPVENTLTAIIDACIGSTRGSLLNRGASAWELITPGTATHVLTSNGAGADPSYQAAAGGLSAASQSDQETAASTTAAVTPGRQQYHPSACKFWAKNVNTSSASASYNLTSITDNAGGDWTFNINVDFSSAHWAAFGLCGRNSTSTQNMFMDVQANPAAGTLRVGTFQRNDGTQADTDVGAFVGGFGDQ